MTIIENNVKTEDTALTTLANALEESIAKFGVERLANCLVEEYGWKSKATVPYENLIVFSLQTLQDAIHAGNVKVGWWKDLETGLDFVEEVRKGTRYGKAILGEKINMISTEIAEMTEGFRKDLMDDKLPHRKMAEVEAADAIIRILDLGGAAELDIAGALIEKLEFNANREDHKISSRLQKNGKCF